MGLSVLLHNINYFGTYSPFSKIHGQGGSARKLDLITNHQQAQLFSVPDSKRSNAFWGELKRPRSIVHAAGGPWEILCQAQIFHSREFENKRKTKWKWSGAVAHGRGVLPGFLIWKYGEKKNAQGLAAVPYTERSKHQACARIATSFELPADPPNTVLHHLSPRPAPTASLIQYHNGQMSPPSSLPSPSSRLHCLISYWRCVALGTQQHPPPLLSFCLP